MCVCVCVYTRVSLLFSLALSPFLSLSLSLCFHLSIYMYSYGSPHTAAQKQDDQHERTFSSYVRIQVVVLKTYLGRWTTGRSGERGSGISVLPARYDDDDDDDIVIHRQTASFYNNSLVWLDIRDAPSWDRDLPKFNSSRWHTLSPNLRLNVSSGICIKIFFHICAIECQSAQFVRRALHYGSGDRFIHSSECKTLSWGAYILSSTDRLFRWITTLQGKAGN